MSQTQQNSQENIKQSNNNDQNSGQKSASNQIADIKSQEKDGNIEDQNKNNVSENEMEKQEKNKDNNFKQVNNFQDDDDDFGGLLSDDSDLLFVEDAESVDLHKDIEINVGDFIFKFKILEILGKNTYLAEDLRKNNEQVIAKVFDNYYLKTDNNQGFKKINNEIHLHSICESKHIVQFYEYFQTESVTAIVMEKCKKSLQDILDEQQRPFTLEETLNYLKQILVSISYLHRNHIIHNQLILQNMLIGNDNIIKIGGFDQAQMLNPDQNFICDVKIQPYIHENSPEIKLKKPFDIQSDMYSLGVMLYKMLQNKIPFNLDKQQKQMVNIFSSQVDFKHPDVDTLQFEPNNGSELPGYIQKLIQSMLNPDPEMRITWKELYEILNDIFQSNQNETKGKEKKKTLSSSKSSQLLRDSKLSLESEMERSFQNSLKNQFYLFSQNDSYGNKKIKKENSDMQKIYKNSKQTVYEVWEFDYIELFQAYLNQSSSNILKEESNDQAQFSYEVSLKDQGINCIKTFHNEKDYLKEVENIQKLASTKKQNQNQINLSPFISKTWNFSQKQKSYKSQNGLCSLQEFSDYRIEKFVPWQPSELIYLFKVLLSTVTGLYHHNLFHSRLNSQNIFIDYNQKNGRLLFKVKNFQYLTDDYKNKSQFSQYIFENEIMDNENHKCNNNSLNSNYINQSQLANNGNNEQNIQTFATKEERLHSEILDIVYIFTELCLKSYFIKQKQNQNGKNNNSSDQKNKQNNNPNQNAKNSENEDNSNQTGSNSQHQESNILLAYSLQEKIFKYACQNYSSNKQKLSYYLGQIKNKIFKEYCIPKNPNPNNIYLPTEFQDGMSQSVAQNSNNLNQISQGSNSDHNKLNASYQPKFPIQKPKPKKSQFSTSNINEVFYSDDEENDTNNVNNQQQQLQQNMVEEEQELDENEENNLKNSINQKHKLTNLNGGNNQQEQNQKQDKNNNENDKKNNINNDDEDDEGDLEEKLRQLDIINMQNNQPIDYEEKNKDFHYSFSHLLDTIQQILVPKLYTPYGLVDFLQRKDIFIDTEYKQICDKERIIDEILKQKLDLNTSHERFGSKTELDAKNDILKYH